MNEPLVCCVMLTRDRPELARRAVECFRAQTYDPVQRMLLILDTSAKPIALAGSDSENEVSDWRPSVRDLTIGALRNYGCTWAPQSSIILHWDDDDWSHPNRIAEQVAFLQSSGADVVGYREMLFWREQRCKECGEFGANTNCDEEASDPAAGEAWLYSNPRRNYALGTSLCYWRKTWETKPFPDLPKNNASTGEDTEWLKGLNVASVSANNMRFLGTDQDGRDCQPRMIARIHGSNTMKYDIEDRVKNGSTEWQRVPEWDEHARNIMEAK